MRNKKILVILGHPLKKSLCGAFADSYEKSAKDSGASIKRINVSELNFDPILHDGYKKIQELEPDLLQLQKDIKWANHLVLIYPIWWGGMPAVLKGLMDRMLLPGFAFNFEDNGFPEKLLKGRSMRLIITMGSPRLIYKLFFKKLPEKVIKKYIWGLCGIKPIKTSIFCNVEKVNKKLREKWIKKVSKLGKKQR